MIQVQLTSLDQLEVQIEGIEDRIAAALKPSPRGPSAAHDSGYRRDPRTARLAGDRQSRPIPTSGEPCQLCWPRAAHIASGGRIRHGGTCRNVNHYLKWGFVEAATCAIRLKAYRESHVGLLYHRLAPNKGHGRATVAVARHLAEASYWVLRRRQPYKAPAPAR